MLNEQLHVRKLVAILLRIFYLEESEDIPVGFVQHVPWFHQAYFRYNSMYPVVLSTKGIWGYFTQK